MNKGLWSSISSRATPYIWTSHHQASISIHLGLKKADEGDPNSSVTDIGGTGPTHFHFAPSALNMQPITEASNRGPLAADGRPCNFPTSIRAEHRETSMGRIDDMTLARSSCIHNLAPDRAMLSYMLLTM